MDLIDRTIIRAFRDCEDNIKQGVVRIEDIRNATGKEFLTKSRVARRLYIMGFTQTDTEKGSGVIWNEQYLKLMEEKSLSPFQKKCRDSFTPKLRELVVKFKLEESEEMKNNNEKQFLKAKASLDKDHKMDLYHKRLNAAKIFFNIEDGRPDGIEDLERVEKAILKRPRVPYKRKGAVKIINNKAISFYAKPMYKLIESLIEEGDNYLETRKLRDSVKDIEEFDGVKSKMITLIAVKMGFKRTVISNNYNKHYLQSCLHVGQQEMARVKQVWKIE